jgi:acyl-CoA synthetase (AMP-forming)/AMP-acid ligase II
VRGPRPVWGEVPAAFIVARPGQAPGPDEIRDWVRGRLRSTRVPAYVELVPELPYNELGKLLRRRLQADFADRAAEPEYGPGHAPVAQRAVRRREDPDRP